MQNGLYKIVHVIDMLQPGGAERVLLTQAGLFASKGHSVHIIATVHPGKLAAQKPPGVKLHVLNRKWKYNPLIVLRLYLLLRKFEVIHIHGYHNLRYAHLALKLPGISAKVFYQEHHGWYNASKPASAEQKRLLRHVHFIAVSQDIANWASLQAGIPLHKISLLPNIVMRQKVAAYAPKQNDVMQLLITSNFSPNKNILFALELLQLARQKTNRNLHLTIAGNLNDAAYHRQVIQHIEQNKLSQVVTIRTDITNIQQVLSQFDLALHCATFESGPLALIEYMAQGLPFLTTNTGQVVQQIKEDLPEFIMNEPDAEIWYNRLTEIINSDKKIWQKRMNDCFDKYYSADQYYYQCLQIYEL